MLSKENELSIPHLSKMSDEEFESLERKHTYWLLGDHRQRIDGMLPQQLRVQNRDLTGLTCNLHSKILTCIDIKNSNLSGLDFTNCILTECNFAGCDLSNCNFKDANLVNSILADTTLTNANFENANMNGSYLAGAQFTIELSKVYAMKHITCEREQLQYLIHNEDFLFSQKYKLVEFKRNHR